MDFRRVAVVGEANAAAAVGLSPTHPIDSDSVATGPPTTATGRQGDGGPEPAPEPEPERMPLADALEDTLL